MLTISDILTGTAQALFASMVATALAATLVSGLPLRSDTGRNPVLAWILVAAPALVPSLLVGYAYAPLLLPLIHFPFAQSVAYSLLVAAKFVPALVLTLALLPPALSSASLHSVSLTPLSGTRRFGFLASAALPRFLCAFALGFVLAFNDFEIAALLGTTSWSVAVFDAHAGGLPASSSIRLAALTLAVQAPVLGLGLLSLRQALRWPKSERPVQRTPSNLRLRTSWILAFSVAAVTVFAPLLVVATESLPGLPAALADFPLAREVAASLFLATLATALVIVLAKTLSSYRHLVFVAAVPCLTGSLLVGLGILSLFQYPIFAPLGAGPIPAILGLSLTALPAAMALRYLARSATGRPAAHAARLSPSPALRWRLVATPAAAVAAIIFIWTYFDVAIPSLLSPPGMTTAFERLHNLMHYGRTSALSAMAILAFLAPVLFVALSWILARLAFSLIFARRHATFSPDA